MRQPRAARRQVTILPDQEPEPPLSNGCPQVAALDRQTDAIRQLTAEIRSTGAKFAPAAEAITELGKAQKKLCDFIVGNRVKILLSTAVLLTLINTVSPNAAQALRDVLKVWSAGQ